MTDPTSSKPNAVPKKLAPKEPRWEMPDTYVIIFFVVVLAMFSTYVIPAGFFETRMIEYQADGETRTREALIPESFQIARDADGAPRYVKAPLFVAEAEAGAATDRFFPSDSEARHGLFNFAFDGLVSGSRYGAAVGVVMFILIIGGAFGIVLRTGAVDAGIRLALEKTRGAEVLFIPVMFILFSLGGAVFGMGPEAIAMAMVLVPLVIAMGYDSITGVMMTYGATQIGFATSWMNPFSVAIAQGMAEVPVLSGSGFRLAMWATFTISGIIITLVYARWVKRNPERSRVYVSDGWFRERAALAAEKDAGEQNPFKLGHALVVATLVLGLSWVVYGVAVRGYYIAEIASQFFTMGLVAGVIGVVFRLNGMRVNAIAESFREGASNLLGAALVVGLATGILLILGGSDPTSPTVLNTLLHGAGSVVSQLPTLLAAWAMFGFQACFNFFVSSGTGQAALTMPLMAPLADFAGVSRQVAVLAFQLGDGLTNLMIPTSAALMGTLAVARIPWTTWIAFQWKVQLIFCALALGFISLGVLSGF